ncbi:MAG: chorismate synthase, partial [bacterium]|nr:chorismate synthase [Candidatus Colousia faecequi]
MNTIGDRLRLTTFGESHGVAIGGVLDGFPSCFKVDFGRVAEELRARAPQREGETMRREPDEIEWLSGLMDGVTLGTPIAFIVRNTCH